MQIHKYTLTLAAQEQHTILPAGAELEKFEPNSKNLAQILKAESDMN